MKLIEFRVQMFKGVIDSGVIEVEHLTTLVGKNESGKTTLLKALHKLNPATPEPYVIEREWPRGRRRDRRQDQVVCTAKFELSREMRADLAQMTDQNGEPLEVTVSRDYAGRLERAQPRSAFSAPSKKSGVSREPTSPT
jgi:ABC-type branched-subunit amino acid transport system ATPase component